MENSTVRNVVYGTCIVGGVYVGLKVLALSLKSIGFVIGLTAYLFPYAILAGAGYIGWQWIKK